MLARAFCVVALIVATDAVAQQTDADVATAMPALAERAIASYSSADRDQYLDNLFRLQLVAGKYAEAAKSLAELRAMRPAGVPEAATNVRWEIYAKAKSIETGEGKPFDEAFKQSFREAMRTIDDKTAYRVLWSFGTSLNFLRRQLSDALVRHKSDSTMPTADAVDLVRKYLGVRAFESFAPLIVGLAEEDDQRRYVVAKEVPVKMPDGGTVCAIIVRPRAGDRRLPTLLNFTIYADPESTFNEALRTASSGFAGVVGLTRGKGCSPDKPMPYEHDGADAAALIDWIAAQSWSDGRVGMYGGSYEGGTAWEAAKRMPKALKGIMTGAPVGPGIDVPMEGNVFWNFVYPWPFYTTNNKTLDNETYNDNARWQRLNHDWYAGGGAYRDMEKIDGTPNPIFAKWLAHPSYDGYWRNMIPYKEEFARIDIPVLTTAGYYYGGPGAAVYYFNEHHRTRPKAEHYLLIGPYDHVRGHSGTISVLGTKTMTSLAGYEIEPAAHIDMSELRYRWFDYVFKQGPRPAILADKVNYEVVGANRWKHARSIAAMSDRKLRFHLNAGKLSEQKPAGDAFTMQTVNLADRSDVDQQTPGGGVVDKSLDTSNGLKFVSDPIQSPAELSGLFSGRLDFMTNKKDFDFNIALYELTSAGDYVQLAPYWARASYVGHPADRRLLTPGQRHHLDFQAARLMSRQLQPGSRIVAVLSVIKEKERQINYGTGRDVSDETIADAQKPLQIQWFADSYLELPLSR